MTVEISKSVFTGLSTNDEYVDKATEEQKWIVKAQVNPVDFEPLYLRYQARIFHYVRARVNVDEDAADLTQQIFLQAIKALPRHKPSKIPFVVWLFRIAHNIACNYYRRYRHSVSWEALPEMLHPANDEDPEEYLFYQEEIKHLKDLVATLSPDKQEMLALRFASGLSITEIAAILGKRPDAVRKQIYRVLQAFKEKFEHV